MFESRPRSVSAIFALVIVFDDFFSTVDFADSILSVQIIAAIGRLAPEKLIRQIREFPNFGHVSNSKCSASLFLEVASLANTLAHHRNTRDLLVSPGDPRDTQC